MGKFIFLILASFILCSCDDPVPPLQDSDTVKCDIDTMLNNSGAVSGASASDMLNECSILTKYLGTEPTFGLLKETAVANVAFKLKGYTQDINHTTERLLQISELRGQIRNGDKSIINNYNIAFKMYSAWDGDVTPDTIYGFLTHAGPLAKTLSDRGLVGAMAATRLK